MHVSSFISPRKNKKPPPPNPESLGSPAKAHRPLGARLLYLTAAEHLWGLKSSLVKAQGWLTVYPVFRHVASCEQVDGSTFSCILVFSVCPEASSKTEESYLFALRSQGNWISVIYCPTISKALIWAMRVSVSQRPNFFTCEVEINTTAISYDAITFKRTREGRQTLSMLSTVVRLLNRVANSLLSSVERRNPIHLPLGTEWSLCLVWYVRGLTAIWNFQGQITRNPPPFVRSTHSSCGRPATPTPPRQRKHKVVSWRNSVRGGVRLFQPFLPRWLTCEWGPLSWAWGVVNWRAEEPGQLLALPTVSGCDSNYEFIPIVLCPNYSLTVCCFILLSLAVKSRRLSYFQYC